MRDLTLEVRNFKEILIWQCNCYTGFVYGWNPQFNIKLHLAVGKAECMLIKPSSFKEHPDSCKALIHDSLFWTLSNNWHIPLVRMGCNLFPHHDSVMDCYAHSAWLWTYLHFFLPPTKFLVASHLSLYGNMVHNISSLHCLLLKGMYSNVKD